MDPISIEVTKALASVFIKSVWETGSGLLKSARLTASIEQQVFNASGKYIENYKNRHGTLKVLGMREPVLLESVYTEVQFLGEQDIQRYESISALEEEYRKSQLRRFQQPKSPKQDGLHVTNATPYLMVLGGPGSGKSTFLKRIGLEALQGAKGNFKPYTLKKQKPPLPDKKVFFEDPFIPIFIELKDLNTPEIDFENIIINEFTICGFPKPDASARTLLRQGKILALLDGLDEVPDRIINQAIRHIQNFTDRHANNRFIVSCRVAAYRRNFRRFSDVEIAHFDDNQILRFILNWFGSDINTAKECWDKLNDDDQLSAKELTQTPLLLTLICLLYQRSRKFPTNRATLYERALRVLLEEWAAEKNIFQQDVYKGLDTKRKELLLSEIAYHAFVQNILFLPRREIANQIEGLLHDILTEEKIIDGTSVLRAIEVQHGVLVERATDIYSFSHLTVQEYLVAQYIDDHRLVKQLVTNYLVDKRWREVILLVAGLMRGGADELLFLTNQRIQLFLNTEHLKNFIKWANTVTSRDNELYKPAIRRLLAILCILDLNVAISRALSFDFSIGTKMTSNCIFEESPERNTSPPFNAALKLARTLDANFDNLDLSYNFACTLDIAVAESSNIPLSLNLALAYNVRNLNIYDSATTSKLIEGLKAIQSKNIDKASEMKSRTALAERVVKVWREAFSFNSDWINLSRSEASALENYFYASELMVRCRETAVRVVSPQGWNEIERELVTVQST